METVEDQGGDAIQFLVGQGQVLTASRDILASCSPVFHAMCLGPLAEAGPVEVPDVSPTALEQLLRRAATGEPVLPSSIDEGCELLYAAKKYLVDDVASTCRDIIGEWVGPHDACRVLEFAESVDELALAETCLELIRRRAREVLKEESFSEVGRTMLGRVLDDGRLEVDSEVDVIEAANRWAEGACKRRGLPTTGPNRRAVLGSLFGKLRFLSLRGTELFPSVTERDLLTLDEFHAVLERSARVCGDPWRPLPGLCAVVERRGARRGPSEFSYAGLSRCPMCGSPLADLRTRERCFRCRIN
ncbi:hypothetical protein PR048_027322 [Dryococelus australis]|uniref:BTB domain-containing protein n=1 Tax=Dryococelus australis TaxID=614101 RepID=A0ABQ9GGL4_9NEOP|nr:hypothetical protein PR048_027322 [Dryococelus australis]